MHVYNVLLEALSITAGAWETAEPRLHAVAPSPPPPPEVSNPQSSRRATGVCPGARAFLRRASRAAGAASPSRLLSHAETRENVISPLDVSRVKEDVLHSKHAELKDRLRAINQGYDRLRQVSHRGYGGAEAGERTGGPQGRVPRHPSACSAPALVRRPGTLPGCPFPQVTLGERRCGRGFP